MATRPGQNPILAVEEEVACANAPTTLLQGFSPRPVVVHDAIAAIRLPLQEIPNPVLVDLLLPGINGFDVIRTVRARPGGASIPAIVITAWSSVKNACRANLTKNRPRRTELEAEDL